MGKLIALLVVGLIGLGVWQGLNGVFTASKLEGLMGDAVDTGGRNAEPEAVKRDFLRRAEAEGIIVPPENVSVEISAAEGTGAAGFVERGGIRASQKRVSLSVGYPYKILGMPRRQDIQVGRVFTMSATMPDRPMPGI